MPEAFNEDFFERIINVKWETEPEVFWMAGSGYPVITNSALLNGKAWIYSSNDGHHWQGQNVGLGSDEDDGPGSNFIGKPRGFGAFYSGGWMRENLEIGADPVWVLVGADGKFTIGSAVAASKDGKFITSSQYLDDRHACEFFVINQMPSPPTPQNPKGGTGSVYTVSQFNYPDWHNDFFTSSDGQKWQPSNYHPRHDDIGGGFAALAAPADFKEVNTRSSKVLYVSTEQAALDVHEKLYLPVRESLITPQAQALFAPQPLDGGSKPHNREAQMVFLPSNTSVVGKVRKGPFAGHQVLVSIEPYDATPPAHGGSKIVVRDVQTGKTLTTGDCGIVRTITINYGHYTFCVGGSSGSMPNVGGNANAQKSTISFTTDLMDWHKVELAPHNQINVIAVGPKRGALEPTGSTGPPSGPTGPGPQPPLPGPTGLTIP